jgi:hypothetical protein
MNSIMIRTQKQRTTLRDAMENMKNELKDTIDMLEQSMIFKEFNEKNSQHYLVHVFTTAAIKDGKIIIEPIEVGYYGRESDMITVFKTSPLKMMPAEEVFKESRELEALNAWGSLGISDVFTQAINYHNKEQPRHPGMRLIGVLQQREMPVWNITIITHTLQMANIKMDAGSGEVLSSIMTPLMSIGKEQ